MDHVDRVSPADRIRKGDEAPSVDCIVHLDEEVIVGNSDGNIRRLGFRPNRYGDVVGKCEDGVTCLAVVPERDGWVVSASGTKVTFLDVNAADDNDVDGAEIDEDGSSEDEKPKKKRKKGKKGKKPSTKPSAVFTDL